MDIEALSGRAKRSRPWIVYLICHILGHAGRHSLDEVSQMPAQAHALPLLGANSQLPLPVLGHSIALMIAKEGWCIV